MTSARRPKNQQNRHKHSQDANNVAPPSSSQQPSHRAGAVKIERIGEILHRTRERRGDNLQYISEYLCIRRSFLEALEDSRYEEFPADAYVIGFLRSYAEYLGMDGKAAIDMYRAEMAGQRKSPVLSMPTPMPEGRAPSVFVMIGALVAAILVYAFWYGLSTSDRTTVTAAPVMPPVAATSEPAASATSSTAATPAAVPPETTSAATPVAAAPAPAAAPQPEQKPAPPAQPEASAKPTHIVIRADQSSWVLVADSHGTTLFDKVLKPGEVYAVPDKPGLTLTTGNGSGIIVQLDGTDLPRFSSSSNGIIRNISLDSSRLKAMIVPQN